VATRAAAQNEQYLELMHTPDFSHTATIAKEIGWHDELSKLRDELLARGLRDDIAPAKAALDQAEALRRLREHCGQPNVAFCLQRGGPLSLPSSAWLRKRTGLCANATVLRDGIG